MQFGVLAQTVDLNATASSCKMMETSSFTPVISNLFGRQELLLDF
jgi:hypothetical protein